MWLLLVPAGGTDSCDLLASISMLVLCISTVVCGDTTVKSSGFTQNNKENR